MSILRTWFAVGISALLLVAGCSGSKVGSDGNNNTDGGGPPINYIGAPGVTIASIAIYQGPKCELMRGGQATTCDVPLVQGRDALFRVFYQAPPSQVGVPFTARLSVDASAVYEVTGNFTSQSIEENMLSTVNFVVPGDKITSVLNYTVGLLQEGESSEDNPSARFPTQGAATVTVEGPVNTIRIIMAPFAYHADGSGRVPDMSQTRIEEFRDRFLQLYPVSDAEITVRQAYDWNQTISPDGSGWQQVGMTLYGFRNQDNAPDDVYYYGIFSPAASFAQFCGMGCLLGVTLLNDQPPDTGQVDMRLALGVGFDEVAVDTAVHEVGHSHGRRHAPCGMGVQDIDPNYPYAGGLIGVWSWDIVNEQIINPDEWTDIMGYCDEQWISDYHYRLLFNRCKNVNLPWIRLPSVTKVTYQIITVDGNGEAVIRPGVKQRNHPLGGGRRVDVVVYSGDGARNNVTGQYFRWDHLPGGWLFVPEQTFDIDTAEFTLEGVPTIALRPLALE